MRWDQQSTVVTPATISHGHKSHAIRHRPLRRTLSLGPTLAMIFLASGFYCFAQSDNNNNAHQPAPVPPQPLSEQSQNEAPSFTFKVVTRMVIVEVVVRDKEDNPVRDLTANDLQVSETIDNSKDLPEKDLPEKIASLQAITEPLAQRLDNSKGIVLGWLHKSFCALTGAYELSYYLSPESRKDGLHRISVTSSREDLTLYFRPGYRIEADKPVEVRPGELTDKQASLQLEKQQASEAA